MRLQPPLILLIGVIGLGGCLDRDTRPSSTAPPPNAKEIAKDLLNGWKRLPVDESVGISLSPDGTRIVVIDGEFRAAVWDLATLKKGPELENVYDLPPRWHFTKPLVGICPNVSRSGDYAVWNLQSGKTLKIGAGARLPLCWAPNGKRVFIGKFDANYGSHLETVKPLPWTDEPFNKLDPQVNRYMLIRMISSPSGHVLAEFTKSGRFFRVYRQTRKDYHFERIVQIGQAPDKAKLDWFPAFGHLLKDGRIVYVRYDRKKGENSRATGVWLASATGENRKKILDVPDIDYGASTSVKEAFSISLDGKTVAIIHKGKVYYRQLPEAP